MTPITNKHIVDWLDQFEKRIDARFDVVESTAAATLEQAKLTNGRVTVLEKKDAFESGRRSLQRRFVATACAVGGTIAAIFAVVISWLHH
jgi:hypothetical protein